MQSDFGNPHLAYGYTRSMKYPVALLIGAVLLNGCGTTGDNSTIPKEILRFQTTSLNTAYLSEDYNQDLIVSGGVMPYQTKVIQGDIPAGITLANNRLSGTPTAAGRYEFTLLVSDTALSTRIQKYTFLVEKQPQATVSWELPPNAVRTTLKVPLNISQARKVQSLRLQWTVPKGIRIDDIYGSAANTLVIWKLKNGVLTADFGFVSELNKASNFGYLQVSPEIPDTSITLTGAPNYQVRNLKGDVVGSMGLDVVKPVANVGTPNALPNDLPKTGNLGDTTTPAVVSKPSGTPTPAADNSGSAPIPLLEEPPIPLPEEDPNLANPNSNDPNSGGF